MLEKEQLAKEKEKHQLRINQLERQIQTSREKRALYIERTNTLHNMERERELTSRAKIENIIAKEDLERHKKLREEREKLELTRAEIDMLNYRPNELQMEIFGTDMKGINVNKAALEHEKMRSAMIRKADDQVIQDLLEVRTNQARSLTGDQLNQIQQDIDSQKQNIQELYFQNTRNEMLSRAKKILWR
jgi:hypothetical protein